MKKSISITVSIFTALIILPVIVYFSGEFLLKFYINSGANKIIELEKKGELSREYGYVWQEIRANQEMTQAASSIAGNIGINTDTTNTPNLKVVDIPSLAAVSQLNSKKNLHKTIRINDRNGIPLVLLQTTHTSLKLSQLNEILLKSLLTTEDQHFYTRKNGYDYNALLRATFRALFVSLRTMKLHYPRGSSTIHMQVARFLLMKYDSRGYAYSEKSISRKIRELKLAQALRQLYSNDEILTLYINHCVSAGRGMLGYHDISMGLFGVTPDTLSIPRSLYLARLVKWNRQIPEKIIHQIQISLPALAKTFNWTPEKQQEIQQSLDTLTFLHPEPILSKNSYLIDLANEYWRKTCQLNGMDSASLKEMDIADPESMIRRYGNLTINLTIDYRLQKHLEKIVASRGFGPDTTIRTDIRVGSYGLNIHSTVVPTDSVRTIWAVNQDTLFTPSTGVLIPLKAGDTVVSNIRYKKLSSDTIRRSCYFYKRDTIRVPGQYYAYAIMDSRTCQLLAYCSKDRLGSRLRSLLVNTNPNGSSVAKPLIYAMSYDMGIYKPTDMTADNKEVPDTCEWARSYLYQNKIPVGMVYSHTPQEEGYQVQNHSNSFDGYDFLFNHLSNSNNIIAVETMYRLATNLTDKSDQSRQVKTLLERLGRKDLTKLPTISGPQLYCALVSLFRNTTISTNSYAQNYSIALGTLELSLYEQMHLFNILYGNRIVVSPSKHPSLFIKSINNSGNNITFTETIETRTVFNTLENINPVHLALHKRLLSNASDRLNSFDFCDDSNNVLSNFAKSGTTDDVIRPFNADITDTTRTSYGLWNAVLGLRLTRDDLLAAVAADTSLKSLNNVSISYDSIPVKEYLDVTLASIGECNKQYTGERDGKTLHGYVSRELLHAFGVPCSSGFYTAYEDELVGATSDKIKYATPDKSNLDFLSRTLIKLQTGIGTKADVDDITFDSKLRLRGKSYRKMLHFSTFMGDESRHYCDLLDKLRNPDDANAATDIIKQIIAIPFTNKVLKRDVEQSCSSLLKSIDESAK